MAAVTPPYPGGVATWLTFGPDGSMYVSLFYGQQIKRYNGITFAETATMNLAWPYGVAVGSDGNVYATSRYAGTIERFSGTSNADLGVFATSPQELLYVGFFPVASGCTASLTAAQQEIQSLQAQLSAANTQNAVLMNQLNAAQSSVSTLTAQNSVLQSQVTTYTSTLTQGTAALQSELAATFNNPTFRIPGTTLIQQYQSLIAAIEALNKGDLMGLYKSLGGK